jgi:capsular exopolysaccharide synthesis family protein
VKRFLSPTLQSERELRVSVRDVNVFAYVPRETAAALSDPSPSSGMPMLGVARRSAFTEAFRTLRTNLSLTAWAGTGNVVLITSPCPGDGKTTTTLSLAAVLAADGRQVLVIDADLRKPSHHEFLNLSNDLGLQGVLSGQYHWRDAVRPVSSSFGEFYSIGAGKAAPSDLLSGDRMSRLLTETRARFDYVLVDTASFPLVADALLLSREADCVLSVLRLQHTPRKLINDHMRRLSESSRNYGVVINDASGSGDAYAGVYPGVAPMQSTSSAVTRVVNAAVQGLSGQGKKR